MNEALSPIALEAITRAVKHRWCVVPVNGKIPIEDDWPNRATADPVQIEALARKYPSCNFGIVTGQRSKLGVLDVDPRKHGDVTLALLEKKRGVLPKTVQAISGSGGPHYYFQYPDALQLGNSSSLLGPGLDFKGQNGQVVMPPSIHPDTKREYQWECQHHPDDVPVAPMPSWLLQLLLPSGPKKPFVCPEVIPETTRQDRLFRAIRSLRCQGNMTDEEIAHHIRFVNQRRCKPPLAEREVEDTIAHALSYPDRSDFNGQADQTEQDSDWPDPLPITADLLPVDPLPLEIVPDAFRAWSSDAASRMQCPPDYIAVPLLVLSSALIGASCGIRPKQHDDWTVVPNLWGGLVGRPGMLKTPAMKESLLPLESLERVAKNEFEEQKNSYLSELEAFKAEKEALQAEMRQVAKGKGKVSMDSLKYDLAHLKEPDAVVWRRYRTNDATIEKLVDLLAENPRGLLLLRDELIGFFRILDSDRHEADKPFFLEAWNGFGSYTCDRIARGTIHVDNLCIALLGSIQPSMLKFYLYRAMRQQQNDGFVQRLQLLVYPDEPGPWELVDTPVDLRAKQQVCDIMIRLASMDVRQHGAYGEDGQRPYYRFDPAGQAVFYEWLHELETKLRVGDDDPVIAEHLSKYRSLMPSLALLFHLIDVAHQGAIGQVSAQSATQAAAWCDYLEGHARRIYGTVSNIAKEAAARLAHQLLKGLLPSPFSLRDVYRKQWTLLDDRSIVERAAWELVALNWLREQVTPGAPGYRGKTEYVLNPKVKDLRHE